MLKNKDLLIVLNTFGVSNDRHLSYSLYLDRIFDHIKINNLEESVRVVISSVMNSDECVEFIKEKYGDKVSIFRYSDHLPVQVTCNKTILSSIIEFDEEYDGYLYISAGIVLPDVSSEHDRNLLPVLIQKNKTNEYGMIHVGVDNDNGYYGLGPKFNNHNLKFDYNIGVGNFVHFHIVLINSELKNFYGLPITDVHGSCGMEVGLSYISYALRKKYILLGDFICHHQPSSDGPHNSTNVSVSPIPCGLNWGRTYFNFLNDSEGIDAGLGYYEERNVGVYDAHRPAILVSNKEKYDENNFSIDDRLKYSIKRQYFTNKNEINYKNINYRLI